MCALIVQFGIGNGCGIGIQRGMLTIIIIVAIIMSLLLVLEMDSWEAEGMEAEEKRACG